MSSTILVRAINTYGAYDEGTIPTIIKPKGMVVVCKAMPFTYGSAEVPPAFVKLYIDTLYQNVEYLTEAWTQNLEWNVISSNVALDSYRLEMYSANAGGGDGNIIQSVLDQFLIDWKFTIFAVADNSITVDVTVYDTLTSFGMWGSLADVTVFSELSYDPVTGVHRISADYSSITRNVSTAIDTTVRDRGGVIVSHDNRVIIFDIDKMDVVAKLKADYQQVGSKVISPRRYMFTEALVDQALVAGGELTLTPAAALAEVIDLSA